MRKITFGIVAALFAFSVSAIAQPYGPGPAPSVAPPCTAFGTTAGTCAQGGIVAAGGPTGSATVAPIITYNAAGQITAISSATITPAVGSITGLGTGVTTLLGGTSSGTGGPAGTVSPTFVTPTLGAATATSVNLLKLASPDNLSIGVSTTTYPSFGGTYSGGSNTAFGAGTLGAITSGTYDVAVGRFTLNLLTTGSYNTGIGGLVFAGATVTGTNNNAMGYAAGYALVSGTYNLFLGDQSGRAITTGSFNTIVGSYQGTSALASNVILSDGNANISYQDDGTTTTITHKVSTPGLTLSGLGSDAALTDRTICQVVSTGVLVYGSGTLGICLGTSSARWKTNIQPISVGLNQIMALQPKSFYLDKNHGDPKKLMYGFIAEDMVKVLPRLVALDKQGKPNTADYLGVVPVLVKAMQQQQSEIASLRTQNRTLAAANDNLSGKLSDLNHRLSALEHPARKLASN